MPRRQLALVASDPDQFFVKELAGETPPSFSTLETLYELAAQLYALRPWRILEENELVLMRDSATGEICYCSVMGSLGECVAMHAYIGTESYRLFRKIDAGDRIEPGEFFASQRSVSVEFVAKAELEVADRKLLAALGHPAGRGLAAPIFRAGRPGFLPWFVTEPEAHTLAECVRAVIEVCSAVAKDGANYWDRPDTYPLVSRVEGTDSKPQYRIELTPTPLPIEPQLLQARLTEEQIARLKGRDYPVRGAMQFDYVLSAASIGKKNERKACTAIALAVDADSGLVLAFEATSTVVCPGDALAEAFLKAIQGARALPREIRVRTHRLKDCLAPLSEACGAPIKAVGSLPALENARTSLLGMLEGRGFQG